MIPLPISPFSAVDQVSWLALMALFCGFVVRLLKSTKLDAWLALLKVPALPRNWIPVIALVVGGIESVLQAKLQGAAWKAALLQVVWGLIAGSSAIAGHEVLAPDKRGRVASLIFGLASAQRPAPAPRTAPSAPKT